MKNFLLKRFNSIPLAILFLTLGFLLLTPAIAIGTRRMEMAILPKSANPSIEKRALPR